jgi:hypothetical protein
MLLFDLFLPFVLFFSYLIAEISLFKGNFRFF